MNRQAILFYASLAFLVLGAIDIIERHREARERNQLLREQRDFHQSMSERLAAHLPYKREIKSPHTASFVPARAEKYMSHISVGSEVDDE